MSNNQTINSLLVDQLKQRYDEITRNETARYYCAKHYRRLHYLLGVPAAVITAIVSSSLFYFLQSNATTPQKIVLASASALAAVLASIQTFLQPLKIAEVNLGCGYSLYVLRLKLEEALAGLELSTNEELKKSLADTTRQMELISAKVPEIPTWIWKKYCSKDVNINADGKGVT